MVGILAQVGNVGGASPHPRAARCAPRRLGTSAGMAAAAGAPLRVELSGGPQVHVRPPAASARSPLGKPAEPGPGDTAGYRPAKHDQLHGQQAFARSGLGAPASTATVHAEFEAQRQAVLELRRVLEERDEELAAARETNRRLMNQLNRSGA